jgi:phage-related protein
VFSSAEKTKNVQVHRQQQQPGRTFFRKAGEESFFAAKESPSFFSSTIQAKLSVSSPDDPQEKEADAVADQVMRMTEPSTASAAPGEEEKIQAKEEKEEQVQAKVEAPLSSVQRACANCDKEDKAQAKLFRMIQRSEDSSSSVDFAGDDADTSYTIDRKEISLHHSDIIQRSGRGPPASSIQGSFEQNLSSSKGAGTALPSGTQQFMESRFNADFSGVRIHTGSYAENLSSSIHAQAFTHGNDIYFNSGKYSPNTSAGGTLLAHELTHTIQQGASHSHTPTTVATKTVARKEIIQRSAAGVPSQLTNAVAKAKTVEGKIDANKPQDDGNRTGWEHLVEIFKSTFGEEMVVSGGSSAPKGAVSEQDIKKKRIQDGALIVDATTKTERNGVYGTKTGSRDAMPSWCGIFVFWALNKSGVPMPKWKLGERMIKPEAARAPGTMPLPGDIAYRNAFSHFAMVESVSGGTVKTVNGNTAGEDNLGGQVQTKDHPLSEWTAFFNPLLIMTGALGDGESTSVPEEPKTLAELRNDAAKLNRKEQPGEENEKDIQAKQELSGWKVDANTGLQTTTPVIQKAEQENDLQTKEEERQQEEKINAGPVNQVQKKATDEFASATNGTVAGGDSATTSFVHAKSEQEDHSLTSQASMPVQSNEAANERGPPVQLKGEEEELVQRSVIDDALNAVGASSFLGCISITSFNDTLTCALGKARDVAMLIPGYKALRVVLGKDPILGERVERNGRNFIEAAFDIMPGGALLHQKLDEQHQLDSAAEWIDGKIIDLESIVKGLFSQFDAFWTGLQETDLLDPMNVIRRGAGIVLGFIDSIITFAVSAALELLEMVKKFLLDKIVEFVKEHTTAYPLLTVILGEDPVTKQKVDRNGTNILNALLELGGEEGRMQRDQMMETGTFQKVVAYIDEGIAVFSDLYNSIVQNFSAIWDRVTIDALMNPVDTFMSIYETFAEPINRVLDFVERVVKEILKLIKDVLFKRISAEAKKVRGYYLVTVLINKDPFTGEVVPRSVENLIHGFMSLMDGGEEQFQQMKESGAIDKAVGKINAAVKRLNMTFESVVQLFIDLWNSFTFTDFLHPIETFQRIIAKFGEPILRLVAFVIEIVKIVVEVILIIMNFPFDLINNIIAKAMQAFELIKKDPIGFLKNLLRAIKEGFMQFFDNILTHLFNGLKTWFLGEVQAAGIPIPTDFTVMGIIKWLLAVLDITMEKIWKKLEERIGKPKVDKIRAMIDTAERVANAAGEAYAFIKDVQERGFMAVMIDKVKEQLSNVWEMVLDAVKGFVMDQIIKKVTVKLLSMLDPTGIMAVVNSAIALYKAIQTFIKYLRQMLEIVNSFVEGTLQIAQGATKKAADFLEGALARGIPIVIGFLANQVGLNLSERLKEALDIVREKVDKALTWVIDKLVGVIEKIVSFGKGVVASLVNWWKGKKDFTGADGKPHKVFFEGEGESAVLIIKSDPKPYSNFLSSYEAKLGDAAKEEVTVDGKKMSKSELIAAAKLVAEDIEKEKRKKIDDYDGADEKEKQTKKASVIDDLLTKLAAVSVPLFGEDKDKPKDSEIVVPAGANTNAFAASQEVKMIWKTEKVTDNGSGPDTNAKHAVYDKINFRQKGNGSYYIRGHLINDNLGGPGKWNNMTALSRTANHEHEGKVESKVKAAFDIGAVVQYSVSASGNQNVKKATPEDKDKFTKIADFATAFPYLEQITEAESQVPTTITCEAHTMKKEGDVWEKDKEIVKDVITFNVGDYSDYEIGDLGGSVKLDFSKLKEELAASDKTFLQFKTQDKIHENSIESLTADQVKELDKIIVERDREKAKNEEMNKIGLMKTADDIATWLGFMAGRTFYAIKTDAAYSEVEKAFEAVQKGLRNAAISAAKTKVKGAPPKAYAAVLWQDFKSGEKINFKANTDEVTDISKIETEFRKKQ